MERKKKLHLHRRRAQSFVLYVYNLVRIPNFILSHLHYRSCIVIVKKSEFSTSDIPILRSPEFQKVVLKKISIRLSLSCYCCRCVDPRLAQKLQGLNLLKFSPNLHFKPESIHEMLFQKSTLVLAKNL